LTRVEGRVTVFTPKEGSVSMPFARTELLRLLRIHREIVSGRCPSLDELAGLCEVHTRTVKRDLRMLREDFGAPLRYARLQGGYCYTRPFSLMPSPLSEQEMLALSITMEIADTFRNSPFVPALKSALQQLRLMYPQSMAEACGDIPSYVSALPEPAPPESLEALIYFNELISAIRERRQVQMKYYTISRDEESVRIVDPYLLYLYRGMWYMHGYCHTRKVVRDFAIWRIRKLVALPTFFKRPDLESVRANLASRFANIQDEIVQVSVWFDEEASRWIRERIWHPSQYLEDHPDGSCTLTMTVAGLTSVTSWVLGFGRHAKALSPRELVRSVAEEVKAMAKRTAAKR
jgi:predicted DNA-binding transcriptional regulator YafY